MDVSMFALCCVPGAVLAAMLGIGDAAFNMLVKCCKPLRDWIENQVEEMEEWRDEE